MAGINYVVIGGRKCKVVLAHRIVAARATGRELTASEVVDHIDFDLLNCRRENLRVVTKAANSQHRKPNALRGVTFNKKVGKWQAQVGHMGRTYYGGLHDTQELAAKSAALIRRQLGFLGGAG